MTYRGRWLYQIPVASINPEPYFLVSPAWNLSYNPITKHPQFRRCFLLEHRRDPEHASDDFNFFDQEVDVQVLRVVAVQPDLSLSYFEILLDQNHAEKSNES